MPFLETPEVRLHYEKFGRGAPVTVFAHGVTSSIEDTRWLGSGVAGSRVFFHFRGHGASGTPADGYDYAAVARDLRAVADAAGAQAAVGVSMGAGAILRVLAETPDRFTACVFVLPAALDQQRAMDSTTELSEHANLVESRDFGRLADFLWEQLPDDLRQVRGMRRLMEDRARRQLANPGVVSALRGLPAAPPVHDRAVLASVKADCLVVAQEGDTTHSVAVARELAAALPRARLHVFARPWSMLRERDTMRALVCGLLNPAGPVRR